MISATAKVISAIPKVIFALKNDVSQSDICHHWKKVILVSQKVISAIEKWPLSLKKLKSDLA